MTTRTEFTAKIEPFDSFWEAPEDIRRGYASFYNFYRVNYLPRVPEERDARILVISCGPGYFVNMLQRHGYTNVLGIDSEASKIRYAEEKGLPCRVENAWDYLQQAEPFDVIFCEQELNHLTKAEIVDHLQLFRERLTDGGTLIVHALNGANPVTGAEALAQNFDHYNSFTEYTMDQVLGHHGFRDIEVFPLKLYVFYRNPLNYVLMAMAAAYSLFFRISFMMYGKKNKLWTKKIGAACRKG
jgi:2-polyprenyl-3-methyl-5-hydroxy-6-metoxy-1,4-benzoquinol methylase